MGKPKLSDYMGWKLRAKLFVAVEILAAYWGMVNFCRRMGWWRAEHFCRHPLLGSPVLKWADRIWLTAHVQCWLSRAIRRELFTTESPVRGRRTKGY